MKNITLIVKYNSDIIDYLVDNTDYSKSKIKSLFKYKKININNKVVDRLPLNVDENDIIVISLDLILYMRIKTYLLLKN